MATKADLIKDLDYLSTTVGERSRVIAFALIAIWWATLIGKETVTGLTPVTLIGPVLLAAASIFCDLAQYALAYIFEARQLRALEAAQQETFSWDTRAVSYKARRALFYLKQLLMLGGLAWFIAILWPFVFSQHGFASMCQRRGMT